FNPADVEVLYDAKGARIGAHLKSDGQPVEWEGMRTMSKSKNNGVDPQELVSKYGADSVRLFMMFKAPPEDTLEWSDEGVEGAARFMRRLWRIVYEHVQQRERQAGAVPSLEPSKLTEAQRAVRRAAHSTLVKVTDDIGRRRVFNTAIAAVMELLNTLSKFDDDSPQGQAIRHEALELVVQDACQALWDALGDEGDALIGRPWPKPDPAALVQEEIEIVVQVNGKLRGRVTVPAQATEDEVRSAALAAPNVQKWTEGKP